MKFEQHSVGLAALALAVSLGSLAFNLRARADGVPTMSPLVYSGTLEEGGALRDGRHDLRLTVYDDAAASDASHVQCTTDAPMTPVTAGRFSVTLHADCATAVRQHPDLWIELTVDRVTLGPRTKLGAVPFALEANRASGLTPAAANVLAPSGAVIAFAGPSMRVPTGWLPCDGRSVPRAMYPALFEAIGTAHGGDGTNFNLPDYRGRFLRGVDSGAMRDPDRAARTAANAGGNTGDAVGSVEDQQFSSHDHGVGTLATAVSGSHTHNWQGNLRRGTEAGLFAQSMDRLSADPIVPNTLPAGDHTHAMTGRVASSGGSETRPVNAAVNYIIKI